MSNVELPRGWVTTTLRQLSLPVSTRDPADQADVPFQYIDISSVDRATKRISEPKRLLGAEAPSRARQVVRSGDILFSTVRPNLQTVAVVPPELDGEICSTGFCVIRPAAQISSEFVFWTVLSDDFQARVMAKARGIAYPAVRDGDILDETLRLPPLDEQFRLTRRLAEHMRRVEDGLLSFASAARGLSSLHSALYAEAFAGRLTAPEPSDSSARSLLDQLGAAPVPEGRSAEWPAHWEVTTLDALSTKVTSGSRDWKPYYERGTGVFVLTQNVRMRQLDISKPFHVDPPKDDPARVRSAVEKNDLLVTIVGANVGNVARVPTPLPEHYVCQSLALVRPAHAETSRFLELYLASPYGGQRYFESCFYGQGRPHLGFADIKRMPVPVPPLEEQQRIVDTFERQSQAARQLEDLLAEKQAEARVLKNALVQDAVTGLLSEQRADDESALDLLERAVAEVASAPGRKKSRRKTARALPAEV